MKKFLTLFTALLLFGSMTVVQSATYKIYINDQTGWANSRALYCWGTGEHLGGWPGSTSYSSENVGGVDYIVFTLADNVITQHLIFNNNNNGKQIDLPSLSAKDYFLNVTSTTVSEVGAPVSNPTIILRGGFNGWGDSDVFTDNGETATFVKTFAAGSYGFKITVGSDWRSKNTSIQRANSGIEYDYSTNEDNATLVADISGDYTFTYTYATQKLSVTFPSEAVVLPPATITAKGSWDGWANDLTFVLAANEETASVTKNLSNTNYSFKVLVNGDWRGNGTTFTRNANSTSNLTSDGNNMTLTADVAGNYTFTWTYETNALAITYPDPASPSVSFSGVPAEVYLGQQVTFGATSENVNTPTYTYYVKQGSGEYGSAVSSYTFNAAGSYTVKVEVRSNGTGEALATAEQAITCLKYSLMRNDHSDNDKGTEAAVCSTSNGSVFTATWTCPSAGTYYFYVTTNTSSDAHTDCDYLCSGQELTNGDAKAAWLYGSSNYSHSYTLNAPRAGEYTFTLTTGNPGSFKCDYPEALDAEVNLDNLPDFAYLNSSLTLADYVGSVNVVQPAYTFYVKKGDAAYGDAVTSYTFDATGEYTVKAEVREQGAGGDALDDIEKTINIYEPLTLYFVNKDDAWSNIHAYAYLDAKQDIKNAEWTGEPMTNTGIESNHDHDVYSIKLPAGRFDKIVFNKNESGNGNQTANLTINAATPYYFDGAWYATLAEADPAILTTDFYLAGSFNGWNTTSDRFMKATESATSASVSVTINTYDDQTFKVIESGAWCGATSATIDKDHTEVTIAASGTGDDITLKPFAQGEYIFTFDLSTRKVTVTYPSTPTVFIEGLENSYFVGDAVTLSATSNLTTPSYSYEVKIGEGEFATAANPYTFAAAGTYTFKVTATSTAGSVSATKVVTVYTPLTLRFVNKEGWSNIHAYAYDDKDDNVKNANWPGVEMTATGESTEGHSYPVYSVVVPQDIYTIAIFNNGNSGEGNQTGNMPINNATPYYYNGEWYASLAQCDPNQSVDFKNVAATILQGTNIEFAATSTNITNAQYTFYVKEEGGSYGDAVESYTFSTLGKYVVKVEATGANTESAVVREKTVEVYTTHTFTSGTKIYVDFTAMTEGAKGVNYPSADAANAGGYDAAGAGTVKIITFSANVEWSTSDDFIKTEKAGWSNGLKFTVPAAGENCAVVAADGASYTWTTRMPTIQLHGNFTGSWIDSEAFAVAGNNETASLTTTINQGDSYQFGVKVDNEWRANGSAFDRFHASQEIVAGSANCTFVADATGSYTFTWTYADNTLSVDYPTALAVALTGLNASQLVDDEVTVGATSNLTNVSYSFELKIDDGEFAALSVEDPYTFAAAGTYTFKVTATGDEGSKTATKEVTVYEPLTLYFVNKEGWSNIHAYAYDGEGEPKNANWPGATMELTAATTANHGYTVYSVIVPKDVYTTAIFNNGNSGEGNQTGNMTINNATPYYYNGAWYATLAECDPIILTTDFYLLGSFNEWTAIAANRFMKATQEATIATTSVTINEYSNITFKLQDNGEWRGCDPENVKTITKDDNTVTILSDAAGENVHLTPYAAGEYVFTLDLTTREVTVTYPNGEAMPIPTNIYLACDELNDWAPADPEYKFTVTGDEAAFTVALAAETQYTFKLVYNSTWLGANYDFKYYWCTDVELEEVPSGVHCNLYSFKEGNYTFRYKLSTSELTIVFPATDATDVTISNVEYATLYSATAFDVPEEVEAYVINAVEGTHLTMDRIYRIPANTGVILHAAEGTHHFYEGDGRWMDAQNSNLLKGTITQQEIENNGLVHYVLSYDNQGQVGLYWPTGTGAGRGVGEFTNNAGKAYLELPEQSAGVIARRGFPFNPHDVPTGIDTINEENNGQKLILNGQLIIIRDGKAYNAMGQTVK